MDALPRIFGSLEGRRPTEGGEPFAVAARCAAGLLKRRGTVAAQGGLGQAKGFAASSAFRDRINFVNLREGAAERLCCAASSSSSAAVDASISAIQRFPKER